MHVRPPSKKRIDDALEMERLATERADAADQARRRSQMAAIASLIAVAALVVFWVIWEAILSGWGLRWIGNAFTLQSEISKSTDAARIKAKACGFAQLAAIGRVAVDVDASLEQRPDVSTFRD